MFSHKSFYSMFWPSGEETNGPDVGLHNKKETTPARQGFTQSQ